MTIIELNKRYYSFPESWNELSTQQAVQVMKLLCSPIINKPDMVVVHLLRILSGCSWWRWVWIKADEMAEYAYLVSFIWETTDLTKNLLPKFGNLYGPADDFNNLQAEEWAVAQSYFEDYREDATHIDKLDCLVATLYRQKRADYNSKQHEDVRVNFNEPLMQHNAKTVVKKWPMHIKLLVFKWYAGCVDQFLDDIKDVTSSSKSEPALYGILSIMRNIAKSGTYGDFNKVEKMYVKAIARELRESKHESDEMDKKL